MCLYLLAYALAYKRPLIPKSPNMTWFLFFSETFRVVMVITAAAVLMHLYLYLIYKLCLSVYSVEAAISG